MDEDKKLERVAPRITILDATELDGAIYKIIKSQVDFIGNFLPAWVWNKFGPELEVLMKFAIWKLSVDKNKASFGQQLLHLKYSDNTKHANLKILAALTIGGPYLKHRLFDTATFGCQSSLKSVETVETLIKLLDIVTFIWFLRYGGSSTFLEHLFKIKPISTVPSSRRSVGYSYMTRELVWHGFIELLVILLPLLNYHRIKRKLMNMFQGQTKNIQKKMCLYSVNSLCEICKESPILPHQMGCSHAFCYLCLTSNRDADNMFECPTCGFYNPDIDAVKPVQVNLPWTS